MNTRNQSISSDFYIEAVIVCVNYSDFLAYTLPANKPHFNKIIVVTDIRSDDSENVANICKYNDIECVHTDDFYQYDAKINKSMGINAGLQRLSFRGWVVQLDADIYLPPMFRTVMQNISKKFDPKCIYGIDRFMCKSYRDFISYIENPTPQHTGYVFINPPGANFELGSRVAQYYGEGYYVIGYFQMWHPVKSGIYTYPTDSIGVDRTDMLFTKIWDPERRILIPEIMAIHLESEDSDMGTNWMGRKSKKFSNECI